MNWNKINLHERENRYKSTYMIRVGEESCFVFSMNCPINVTPDTIKLSSHKAANPHNKTAVPRKSINHP